MRCKWYFRNESQDIPSEISTYKLKSTWNPPKGSPALELFLSKVKEDIFSVLPGHPKKFNLSKEKYLTMRSLQNDRSVIIKPADKGSAVVVWDRQGYLKEAERQLSDSSVYKEVKVTEKDLVDLVDKSNKIFANLERRNIIQEKEKSHFKFNFKKATNVGKFYLLPKIHKSLSKVQGRPVISNCGMPTEKLSEFLDHHLKPLMKQGESYIKDTGDFHWRFLHKFKSKSIFKPRNKDVKIEIYLSSLGEKLMSNEIPKDKYNNLARAKRGALFYLKNDKAIVIKGADKGSTVIVWDRDDYIQEAEK